mgnify:CR=1 FL=1
MWVALVVADQATKWIAQLNLSFGKSVYIIPKTLTFDLVHNYGAAYGIFQNQQLFLLTVSVIVIVGGYVFADKIIQTIYSKIGLIFLLAGAFGNFIDRLCLGYVIDFINIYIFPVFNFADIYINIAVLLFVIEMFKHEKNKDNL